MPHLLWQYIFCFCFPGDEDAVEADGPHSKQYSNLPQKSHDNVVPKFCDVLLCHAVVPGYVALRDKNKGKGLYPVFMEQKF